MSWNWMFLGVVGMLLLAGTVLHAEVPVRVLEVRDGRILDGSGIRVNATGEVAVTPEKDSLRATNIVPSRYCVLSLNPNQVPYTPDLVLRFEYRNSGPEGVDPGYLGVNLFDTRKRMTFHRFPASAQWRQAQVSFSGLKSTRNEFWGRGDVLARINLYGRLSESQAPTKMTLEVRNLRIEKDPRYNPLAGVRVSYSARVLFNWERVQDAQGYVLEYSVDPVFPAGKTVIVETPFNFAVSPEALAPGLYYWQATALPSGIVVSRDRVVVPDPAHTWELPEYDFAQLAKKPHPRLLPLAREQFEGNAEAAAAAAERELDFQLPPDPQPYREGADPRIRARIEWYGTIADGIITPAGRKMALIGQAAVLTGRRDFVDKARELALAVARTWNPNNGSHMKHCDLQAANLLTGLVWCYDAAWHSMTPEERKDVAAAIEERGRQYWEDANPFRGNEAQNHSWDRVQAIAFAAVGLAAWPEAAEWFDFAAKMFAYRFLPSLGFDGENNEGMAYWSYGTGLALKFVDLARAVTPLDLYRHPWLARTARFPLYSAPQEGYQIAFADNGTLNHGQLGPAARVFTGKLARHSGDAVALWYAGMPGDRSLRAEPPVAIPQSVYYPHIGVTLFNTFLADGRENVAVGFHAGKFFAGHQHADQNSFVINAYGDKLAIDGGYYDWWGSPHFNGYSTQTVAHNTILVNGKGQVSLTEGADAVSSGYFDSPNFGVITGDASAPEVYGGALSGFVRRLVFVKPDFVITYDRLKADTPSVFRYQLHTHTDRQEDTAVSGAQLEVRRPLARLNSRMLLPRDAAWQVNPAYDLMPMQRYLLDPLPRPQPEWTAFAENSRPARECEFLNVMQISRRSVPGNRGGTPHLLENAAAVGAEFDGPGGRTLLIFRRGDAGEFRLGDVASDAAAVAVTLRDGQVVDAMLSEGTFLRYQGRDLLRLDAPGARSLVTVSPARREAGKLLVDGGTIAAERWTVPVGGEGVKQLLSAVFELPVDSLVTVSAPAENSDMHYTISSRSDRMTGTLTVQHPESTAFLRAGSYLVSVATDGTLPEVTLQTVPENVVRGQLIGQEPPQGALLIDAADFVAENVPAARLEKRAPIPGGMGVIYWAEEGKYLEWEFPVPKEGRYRLALQVSGLGNQVLRDLIIDGERVAILGWDSTGVAGYAPAEWRYLVFPKDFELTKGMHRLRLAALGGVTNLSRLALLPEVY